MIGALINGVFGLVALIILLAVGIVVGIPILAGYGIYKFAEFIENCVHNHRVKQNQPDPSITLEGLKQDFQNKYHIEFDKLNHSKNIIEKLQNLSTKGVIHEGLTPNEMKEIKKELKHEAKLLKKEIKHELKSSHNESCLFHRKSKKYHNETQIPYAANEQKIEQRIRR